MTEEKSWLGEWTFNVESVGEIRLFGVLSYSPNGSFILEASMEHTSYDIVFDLQRINRVDYIVGLDYKTQKNLTLVNNLLSSYNWSTSGGNLFKISPTLLIEGVYYDNNNELSFDSLTVKYSGLNQWLRVLNVSKINVDNEDTLNFSYKRSESISCRVIA